MLLANSLAILFAIVACSGRPAPSLQTRFLSALKPQLEGEADVVFVLDRATSSLEPQLQLIDVVLGSFSISSKGVRVASVLKSAPTYEFRRFDRRWDSIRNSSLAKCTLRQWLRTTSYEPGEWASDMNCAIGRAWEILSSGRPSIRHKIVVIFVNSNDADEAAVKSARELKDNGVSIFVLGFCGSDVDLFGTIAPVSDPKFFIGSFKTIDSCSTFDIGNSSSETCFSNECRNGKCACLEGSGFTCDCNAGYKANESSGQCEAIKCPDLVILNGTTNGECKAAMYKSTCTLECNEGYELVGSSVRSCELDGRWSGCTSFCEPFFHYESGGGDNELGSGDYEWKYDSYESGSGDYKWESGDYKWESGGYESGSGDYKWESGHYESGCNCDDNSGNGARPTVHKISFLMVNECQSDQMQERMQERFLKFLFNHGIHNVFQIQIDCSQSSQSEQMFVAAFTFHITFDCNGKQRVIAAFLSQDVWFWWW